MNTIKKKSLLVTKTVEENTFRTLKDLIALENSCPHSFFDSIAEQEIERNYDVDRLFALLPSPLKAKYALIRRALDTHFKCAILEYDAGIIMHSIYEPIAERNLNPPPVDFYMAEEP